MSGKGCSNCKYEDLEADQSPCATCFNFEDSCSWAPKQANEGKPMEKLTLEQAVEKFKGRTLKPGAMEQIEGMLEPVSRVWKPKDGETVYGVNTNGATSVVYNSRSGTHVSAYEMGFVFQTHAEVEFLIEKLKVTAELQRYADEHNDAAIDWKNLHQEKFFIYYTYYDNKVCVDATTSCSYGRPPYFASRKTTLDAISTIGEDRIKKYYLGVKE